MECEENGFGPRRCFGGLGIPNPWRLNEDEMVGFMRIFEAAENEYAGKTLVTSEGTLEWGEHQELLDSPRADIF